MNFISGIDYWEICLLIIFIKILKRLFFLFGNIPLEEMIHLVRENLDKYKELSESVVFV